jgi:acyl dehydratase
VKPPALPDGLAGARAGPRGARVDARWLMAYAAALGDAGPERLDTRRPGGVLAHPLFPVCYEWPLALALRRAVLAPAVARRAVHATHDLRLHRLPRAGDRLRTTLRVVGVEAWRGGAFVLTRAETVDAAGAPVTATDHGTLYRGVAAPPGAPPGPPPGDGEAGPAGPDVPLWSARVAVPPTLAHVYGECARIWNPIHADRAAAAAAGLPDIVLHGTATLALAVSALLGEEGAGSAARVRRVAGRLGAYVLVPSVLTVRRAAPETGPWGRRLRFTVETGDGRPAVRSGLLELAPG